MTDGLNQENEINPTPKQHIENSENSEIASIEANTTLINLLTESESTSQTLKSPQDIIEDKDKEIENLRKQVEGLVESSRIDKQTGLYNKNAYIEDLYPILLKAFREGKKVGILALDLQGLKRINDTEGHDAGDELIAKYGGVIKKVTDSRMRKTDKGYRTGGDEAVVILFDTDDEGVEIAAQDYKLLLDEEGVKTGIGAGIIDSTSLDTMMASMDKIDKLLYASKKEGYQTGENNIKLLRAA